MNNMQEFNNLISERVSIMEREKDITHERIASYLNVSENFIKKVHSMQNNSHYNVLHLWKLAQLFNTKVDDLLPPVNNFYKFKELRPGDNKNDYKKFLDKYKSMEEL